MDLKIIEAVQDCPCLYGDQIGERDKLWKQISNKLEIEEQTLKIRWHFLVQRYQANANFKYSQQMSFIKRQQKNKSGSWPEFEITEEDLIESQGNSNEYVFMDVDAVPKKDNKNQVVKIKNEGSNTDTDNTERENIKEITERNNKKDESSKSNKETEDDCNEKQKDAGEISREKAIFQQNKEPEVVKPAPERCEDIIFGELVAAMLKRMDEDKKRIAKKEIMNILLT